MVEETIHRGQQANHWPIFPIVLQNLVDDGNPSIFFKGELEKILKDNKVRQDLVLDLEWGIRKCQSWGFVVN